MLPALEGSIAFLLFSFIIIIVSCGSYTTAVSEPEAQNTNAVHRPPRNSNPKVIEEIRTSDVLCPEADRESERAKTSKAPAQPASTRFKCSPPFEIGNECGELRLYQFQGPSGEMVCRPFNKNWRTFLTVDIFPKCTPDKGTAILFSVYYSSSGSTNPANGDVVLAPVCSGESRMPIYSREWKTFNLELCRQFEPGTIIIVQFSAECPGTLPPTLASNECVL